VTATPLSSELLGFPPDARVLIVNADDLGMHPSINTAVVAAIEEGIARSCSLMTSCPGTLHALGLLRDRPEIPFGIHLTLVRDSHLDRWKPVGPVGEVSSLVDAGGELYLHEQAAELLGQARTEEVEREFRAQLETVLRAGLAPTHLDFHSLADGGRDDILDVAMALAAEHGLAVRVWLEPGRRKARARGLPGVDHGFLDSFALDLDGKADRYAALLRALPPGLSEWAVHPGTGDAAARAADPAGWRVRRSDYEFLVSAQARALVADEGIALIDYRPLQQAWRLIRP
jgi:chitin disaccharide deacetylase